MPKLVAGDQKISRQRHVPMRRCLVCRAQRPQAELLRLYLDEDGLWQLDSSGKAGKRGAWVCLPEHEPACVNASTKQLSRYFRGQAERVQACLQQYTDTPSAQAVTGSSPAPTIAVELVKEVVTE